MVLWDSVVSYLYSYDFDTVWSRPFFRPQQRVFVAEHFIITSPRHLDCGELGTCLLIEERHKGPQGALTNHDAFPSFGLWQVG